MASTSSTLQERMGRRTKQGSAPHGSAATGIAVSEPPPDDLIVYSEAEKLSLRSLLAELETAEKDLSGGNESETLTAARVVDALARFAMHDFKGTLQALPSQLDLESLRRSGGGGSSAAGAKNDTSSHGADLSILAILLQGA